ncbi:hypothetical protein ACLOJK_010565 [Asimina triloba]
MDMVIARAIDDHEWTRSTRRIVHQDCGSRTFQKDGAGEQLSGRVRSLRRICIGFAVLIQVQLKVFSRNLCPQSVPVFALL